VLTDRLGNEIHRNSILLNIYSSEFCLVTGIITEGYGLIVRHCRGRLSRFGHIIKVHELWNLYEVIGHAD
jgi:hypothetical protein